MLFTHSFFLIYSRSMSWRTCSLSSARGSCPRRDTVVGFRHRGTRLAGEEARVLPLLPREGPGAARGARAYALQLPAGRGNTSGHQGVQLPRASVRTFSDTYSLQSMSQTKKKRRDLARHRVSTTAGVVIPQVTHVGNLLLYWAVSMLLFL